MTRAVFLLTITVLAAVGRGGAQTSTPTAWFGVPLPPHLVDPHRPVVETSTAAPRPPLVPTGEEHNTELAGSLIRKDLDTIVGFSQADRAGGAKAWGRITGTPSAAAAMTWAAGRLRDAGLQKVEVQPYEGTGQ